MGSVSSNSVLRYGDLLKLCFPPSGVIILYGELSLSLYLRLFAMSLLTSDTINCSRAGRHSAEVYLPSINVYERAATLFSRTGPIILGVRKARRVIFDVSTGR